MIVLLKLSSGIEVVGHLEIENNSEVILNKPLQINYKYFFNNTPSLSLTRFILFAESDSIVFDKTHIVCKVIPREVFERFYNESVKYFYEELSREVDAEMEMMLNANGQSDTRQEAMKKFLEMMPVNKDAAN